MWNKSVRAALGAFALIVLAAGCSQESKVGGDPKARLSEYISYSFSAKNVEDRMRLLGYLRDGAKLRLEAWSDDQFRQAFLSSKRRFLRLSFKELKAVNPKEVSITYEVSYLDQGRGNEAKVTNKKLAQLVEDKGEWFITDVRNIKELVEYQNEMSLP